MITVKQKVQFTRGKSGRRRIVKTSSAEKAVPAGRVPRVSKLMALAIRFEGLLRSGVVFDQSELARLAKVTQPRMTQIMNLLHLAPDIQEELLFLSAATSGRDPIHEKLLRRVAAELRWRQQRLMWANLRERVSPGADGGN